MRYVIILLLSCLACEQAPPEKQAVPVAEDSTFLTGTFYLVRHAEQAGVDSSIAATAHLQAGALYRLLQDSGIQKIYFTRYPGSLDMADSMYQYLSLDTVSYVADSSGEGLLYEITRQKDWGKKLLVVGNNRALVPIMHSLKAKPKIDSVAGKDYSSLFIVRKYKDSVRCKRLNY